MDFFGQFFVDAMLLGGIYTLMVIGLSLSFGIIRIINFAHGEAIMLGAYGSYWALTILGLDPLVALPLIMVAGMIVGMAIYKISIKRVLTAPHINQILLTFGIGLILQNLALISWSADERSVNPPYAFDSMMIGDISISTARVIAFAVATILVVGLFLWLRRTELGRASRALAENGDAAILMGINVTQMYGIVFGISAALGAATGVLLSFIGAISPFMGFHMLVKGFAIIILGGLGSIVGSVVGAFVLAFAETWVAYYVPGGAGWSEGVAFALLFLILIIRPRGLLGQAVEE
ncbi:branched-chain amino acid transport system permease protein [Rhodoligotrophos appendicifer]|uniref:branched-chain amino acid ABC transporter permease n=1 Tax=Rhodoligotrophos appendicifer TaxID=987056 RepID=UPI0011852235|nr:branched-chain amino acid ABC transporter permease [Rhodoligotrophos appendicifer]